MADRVLTDDPEAHFTDRYKFPGHPTFSVESIYSNDRTPGGTWEERDGVYYYHPSEYTFGYIGRTLDYLAGSESDGIYLEGKYMMIPSMGDGGAVDTGRPYGKGKYVIDPDRADEGKRNDVYDEIAYAAMRREPYAIVETSMKEGKGIDELKKAMMEVTDEAFQDITAAEIIKFN